MKRAIFLSLVLALVLALPAAAYDMGAPETPTRLSAGLAHTVYVDEDGVLWAWGSNQAGQLGEETQETGAGPQGEEVPLASKPIKVMEGVVSASAGADFTLALKADGTLWAWGGNDYGQLGRGSTEASAQPVQILDQVTAVSAGDYHAAALRTDGTLWTWGDNLFGQLGDGALSSRTAPALVLTQVTAVSAGANATAALRADGTLWTWGDNLFGQLGDGTLETRPLPRQILSGVAAVSMGGYHAVTLGTDGTLWTWGSTIDGQLGQGAMGESSQSQTTPTPVELPAGTPCQLSAGTSHTAVLTQEGTLFTWGRDATGQLGRTESPALPGLVSTAQGAAAVAAGTYHTACLLTDGTLVSWGPEGLLGGGSATTMASLSPDASGTAQAAFPGAASSSWGPLALLAGSAALMLLLGLIPRKGRESH